MVRSRFCQRSQIRGMKPAIGVWRGHVNVVWRHDQQGKPRSVRERVDFFALADAQRGPAQQEKGDVGAEVGGDVQKLRGVELLTGELQIAKQRGRRVAGTSPQSASSGNLFLEGDFDA